MDTIKVFLSSRVNSEFQNVIADYTLKKLRTHIKLELEKSKVLDLECLEVIINEDSFDGKFNKDWYERCLIEMRESQIIIILYTGDAGWSEKGSSTNGICHEEFILAASEFSSLSYGFDLSKYFVVTGTKDQIRKNEAFVKNVRENNIYLESIDADTSDKLEQVLVDQIKQKIQFCISSSIETQKTQAQSSNVFVSTLDWTKMSYSERIVALTTKMEIAFDKELMFKDIIKQYHAIPDNMSVADARNRIERPFLKEHELIPQKGPKPLSKGVVHFIGVYGSVTEIQAKNLVGYPDLTVIKAPFGFYLWDKIRHIQIFFIGKCINPEKVGTRLLEIKLWISASKELGNIKKRAAARFQIIEKISEMQTF